MQTTNFLVELCRCIHLVVSGSKAHKHEHKAIVGIHPETDRQTETDIMSITPKNSRYINSDASLEHLRVHC